MLIIRPALVSDASFIVHLIRDSFDTQLGKAVIYGCHGIEHYLRHCIATPDRLADTIFVVADDGNKICGCVELRLFGTTVFLNYICTSEGVRHKGLGKAMLRESLNIVGGTKFRIMSLDVFHDNHIARSWYENLGFLTDYNIVWWKLPSGADYCCETGVISGIAAANVCHLEFGFSQFTVTTSQGSYSVGRLGDDWFRTSQENLLADNVALATLYRLDKRRRILGILREDTSFIPTDGALLFRRSARMSIGMELLVNRLNSKSNCK